MEGSSANQIIKVYPCAKVQIKQSATLERRKKDSGTEKHMHTHTHTHTHTHKHVCERHRIYPP